jgi:carboxymethylenebutenolidase
MALHEYVVQEVALDCAEGHLTRREAFRRLGLLGLSTTAAGALLAACGSDEAATTTSSSPSGGAATTAGASTPTTGGAPTIASTPVPATAAPAATAASAPTTATASTVASGGLAGVAPSTVAADEIRFAGPSGELIGAFAAADDPQGVVLVIHENRGLTPHIRTIPTRLAADGYTALAIDLLSEEGGTASLPSEGDATAALGNAPTERMIADLRTGIDELQRRAPGAKAAVIGFCFGGGMTWSLLGAGEPRLAAAVPFYGPFTEGTTFTGSPNAAVLAMYGALDSRVDATRAGAEAALDAAGLVHESRIFEGADHAFFNDTGPRYDAAAATQAYTDMIAWFRTHLS